MSINKIEESKFTNTYAKIYKNPSFGINVELDPLMTNLIKYFPSSNKDLIKSLGNAMERYKNNTEDIFVSTTSVFAKQAPWGKLLYNRNELLSHQQGFSSLQEFRAKFISDGIDSVVNGAESMSSLAQLTDFLSNKFGVSIRVKDNFQTVMVSRIESLKYNLKELLYIGVQSLSILPNKEKFILEIKPGNGLNIDSQVKLLDRTNIANNVSINFLIDKKMQTLDKNKNILLTAADLLKH